MHERRFALFTKTQRAVLASVFHASAEGVSFADVVRAAGGGFGGTQKVLRTLEKSGLISARSVGNQRRYSANMDHPIAKDLRAILDKTMGFVDVLREALAPLGDRIELAFVFGSVSRKAERAHSDIDLAIVGKVSRREIALPLEQCEEKLGRTINVLMSEDVSRFVRLLQHPSRQDFLEALRNDELLFVLGKRGALFDEIEQDAVAGEQELGRQAR